MSNYTINDCFTEMLRATKSEEAVDYLLTLDDFAPPPNTISPAKWRQEKRQELIDFFSNKALLEQLKAGYAALMSDLQAHVSASDFQSVTNEWSCGIEKYFADKQLDDKRVGEAPTTLFEVFGFSEDTFNLFFQSAMRCFDGQEYQKAADMFQLMTFFDHRRFNVWLFKGLSDRSIGQFDEAIQDFSIASQLNVESPLPHIFMAECSIDQKNYDQATDYMSKAYEAVEKQPVDMQPVFYEYIGNLKSKI